MENSQFNSILIGITSSLIASVIFYFAIPLFKNIGKQIVKYFERTNKQYRNSIILRAARRDGEHTSDLTGVVIFSFALIIGIAMVVGENVDLNTSYMEGLRACLEHKFRGYRILDNII